MKLPEPLEKLQSIKNAKWIGLGATIVLSLALMISTLYMDPDAGYYVMMVGLVAVIFAVPYLFGWRDGKQLAILGIGLFILLGAVWGPMTVHRTFSMDEPEPVSSAARINWFTKEYTVLNQSTYQAGGAVLAQDVGVLSRGGYVYAMDNGDVTPYKGDIGQGYNFTITLYSNDTFPDGPDLTVAYALGVQGSIDIVDMLEVDPADTNFADGKEYYYLADIQDQGIYSHVFCLRFDAVQPVSLNTTVALGPLVGEESSSYGFYALIGIPSMFCNIGMLFVILVLLYWWIGTAKEKRRSWDMDLLEKEKELDKEPEEKDDTKPFTCDQCGAGVGVDDNFCPKCGERFDEVEEDEPEVAEEERPVPDSADSAKEDSSPNADNKPEA